MCDSITSFSAMYQIMQSDNVHCMWLRGYTGVSLQMQLAWGVG